MHVCQDARLAGVEHRVLAGRQGHVLGQGLGLQLAHDLHRLLGGAEARDAALQRRPRGVGGRRVAARAGDRLGAAAARRLAVG
jgi:hypothetical protein